MTFVAAELALGSAFTPKLSYFDRCRRMRNDVDYDHSSVVTEVDATDLLKEAILFIHEVETWIVANHPQLT